MENKETKKQTKKNRERKLKGIGEGTISEMLMCTIMRNWDIRWNPF